MKTAKSIVVLRVLSSGEQVPFTVSTLAEARYFFEHGVRDILYAVGLAPVKLPQIAELIRAGCQLRVILDSVEAADVLQAFCKSGGSPSRRLSKSIRTVTARALLRTTTCSWRSPVGFRLAPARGLPAS